MIDLGNRRAVIGGNRRIIGQERRAFGRNQCVYLMDQRCEQRDVFARYILCRGRDLADFGNERVQRRDGFRHFLALLLKLRELLFGGDERFIIANALCRIFVQRIVGFSGAPDCLFTREGDFADRFNQVGDPPRCFARCIDQRIIALFAVFEHGKIRNPRGIGDCVVSIARGDQAS